MEKLHLWSAPRGHVFCHAFKYKCAGHCWQLHCSFGNKICLAEQLNNLFQFGNIKLEKPDHLDVYGDVEGHRCNGGTIPFNIVVTQQKPDIVIWQKKSTVWLFELTVSTDIGESGYDCKNVPFEVWSRGHISISNHSSLATLHGITTPKSNWKCFYNPSPK